MTKTLIIPGLDGSPAPHWQHLWAASDPSAILVDLSDPHHPLPAVWETEVAGMILRHPDSILVGHSLGAVLVSRLLARWPQLRVRAALLVAPAEPANHDRIGAFAPIPESRLDVPSVVVASRNDPWMSFARASSLAAIWGASLVDLGFAGHINVASGYGPWQGGIDLRNRLLSDTETATPPKRAARSAR